MKEADETTDTDVDQILREQADKYEVPTDLLIEISREEKRAIDLENRYRIHVRINEALDDYLEEWEP